MKSIVSLWAAILTISSTAVCGDVTIGLQTGAPALLGARIAYMGGSDDNRELIVDATLALSLGWTGNVGAGYALGGGPWYVGARYHYLELFGFIGAQGSAVGPEFGIVTPLFGSKVFYFNAYLGAVVADDDGDVAVAPTAQLGLNIAL